MFQTFKNIKYDHSYDFNAEILFEELKFIESILTNESKSNFTILNSLKIFSCFPYSYNL